MYTSAIEENAYAIVADGTKALHLYRIEWDLYSKTGSLDFIQDMNYTYTPVNYTLTPSQFTVVGDRLFVVLSEINQIWVYSLADKGASKLYEITLQSLGS